MNYTYIKIFVEDESGSILVEEIMKKYIHDKENIEYSILGFKGIGKIPKKLNKKSEIKTNRLLTDLPQYLIGMDKYLSNMQGRKAIFVLLDADDEDCKALKQQLVAMVEKLNLEIEVFFCIAVEEMEAWLLGDKKAVLAAYPGAKRQILQKYQQDGIVGTWECLADIVYKGGVNKLKKDKSNYYEIGKFKCECAKKIGQFMDINNNESPSYNYFIKKLDSFVG